MIGSFGSRRVSPGRGWRYVVIVVIVVVAALALVPEAFADGWSLQSVPLPRSPGTTRLNGVACPATNDCYAVGSDTPAGVGSEPTALIEKWNGTEWFVFNLGGPGGELDSVSCPTTSFCEAVGDLPPVLGRRPAGVHLGRRRLSAAVRAGAGHSERRFLPVGVVLPGGRRGDVPHVWSAQRGVDRLDVRPAAKREPHPRRVPECRVVRGGPELLLSIGRSGADRRRSVPAAGRAVRRREPGDHQQHRRRPVRGPA